jgi:hypothetical protein
VLFDYWQPPRREWVQIQPPLTRFAESGLVRALLVVQLGAVTADNPFLVSFREFLQSTVECSAEVC